MNPNMNPNMNPREQKPSRFKNIDTSEHLYNLLVNGLENFRNSFRNNNRNPPPMKIFLKLYTQWCAPCKKIAPHLDDLSMMEEHKDIIFLKCNADLITRGECQYSKQLQKMLNVNAVPMFLGMIDKNIVGNVVGIDTNEIYQLLNKLKG